MGYLVDRQRAVGGDELVAVLAHRRRGARSRLVLSDNSLYHTLTRPLTVIRVVNQGRSGASPDAGSGKRRIGVTWWIPS